MKDPEADNLKTKFSEACMEAEVLINELDLILESGSEHMDYNPDRLLRAKKLYHALCKKNREIKRLTFEMIGVRMN